MAVQKSQSHGEPELTTKQLAEHFNIRSASILDWRLQGMPARALNTRVFRYRLSEVEKWLDARDKK